MAVGGGSRHGRKLNDGSSVIDKRYYGRSRKQRVRPAPDEPPPESLAAAPAAEVLLPQLSLPAHATPATEETPDATAPEAAPPSLSELPPGPFPPSPSYPPSPSSSSPSATSYNNNQSPLRKHSYSSHAQQSNITTPPSSKGSERESQSYSDRNTHPHRRGRHRNSTNHPPASRRLSVRSRSASHRRGRGSSSAWEVRSRSLSRTPPSSSATEAEYGSSSSSSGGGYHYRSDGQSSSGWSSTGTSAERSRDRHHARKSRRTSRSGDGKRRSNNRDEDEYDDRYRHRSGRGRAGRRHSRHSGGRRYERRLSGKRRGDRKRNVDKGRRSISSRHGSRSHRSDGRRRRRSRGSDGEYGGREGRNHRKHIRQQQYRDPDDGQKIRRGRSRGGDTVRRRHSRGGKRNSGWGGKPATMDHSQQGGLPHPIKVSTAAGGGAEAFKKAEAAARGREELRATTIKAVVTVQRTARGFVARNRVAGRREALATLRSACLGVAMGVIDAYIREDVAPDVISEVLAGGFQGGELAARQRAEAAEAACEILDETTSCLIGELVTLVVTGEANSHLDVVFARDRRNPLLVTVDDVVAETLRVFLREAVVVEVVKECAEDFMFDKRILALVKGLIEDGVVESVGPIAAEVYYKAAALAAYLEMEKELCAKEARSIVAETMAPFEDQLVEMQREKDFAAIQAAAQSVMVKGLQLQHAARTVGQRGRLVLMSDINGKTLNLLLAGRFLAILRAAETNRLQVSTSPLLFTLFRRLVVRTGRSVLLEQLSRELDRDEATLHALELERIDEVDRQRRRADRERGEA